jgi:VIT1/CCC1 family predicted Fe2+/Mn2+ transporter
LIGAAIGCNLAWGIIDAVMYVMNEMFQRARRFRVIAAIRRSKDHEEVLRAIGNELDPGLEAVSEPAERRRFYEHIIEVAGNAELPRTHFKREDFMGAVAAFLLVVVSAAPASIPFLVIDDPRTALRVSNGLLLAMLFGVGWAWAGYTNIPRWRMASVLTGIGLVLVGIAIPLGG